MENGTLPQGGKVNFSHLYNPGRYQLTASTPPGTSSDPEQTCNAFTEVKSVEVPQDSDGDEIVDADDNCPEVQNPDQLDTDGDGIGDVCDEPPDSDRDGVPDATDNCPTVSNPIQGDDDGDGIGNVCDPCPFNPGTQCVIKCQNTFLTKNGLGTPGRDVIVGTARRDVINALGGNDTIRGLGGNDLICGGDGRDILEGNQGNDRLHGQAGNDRLNGGSGFDRCHGGFNTDTADNNCEVKIDIP